MPPEFAYDLPPDAPVADLSVGEARRIGSALTDETGAPSGQQTDHVTKGNRRMIRFFRTKPRIAALLSAFTSQVQDLENLAWAWYATSRDLSTVGGVLLDRLAGIVDELRNGRTDTELRAVVRVKIKLLSSDGKIEQLIAICKLLFGEAAAIGATEHWPAHISISTSTLNGLTLEYTSRLLRIAKAAGVSLDLGLSGGLIGDVDGDPLGAAIGSTTGVPVGGAIGLVV